MDPAIHLRPMTTDEIADLVTASVPEYRDELIAGGMLPEAALAKARADHEEAFPDGAAAPGHLAFAAELDGRVVGRLWLGPAHGEGAAAWWVYDVEVASTDRGRGIGRAVMSAAEEEVRSRGGTSLGLQVFGGNAVARHLYESLGYEPTTVRMRKTISDR
jgi:GNAT superfamily N-acetyltransferase